jgi:transposase
MARSSRHPREVRERAVALVLESQSDYGSQWEAIVSVAQKVGVSSESLRRWVRQAEVDVGARAGTTSADAEALRSPDITPGGLGDTRLLGELVA